MFRMPLHKGAVRQCAVLCGGTKAVREHSMKVIRRMVQDRVRCEINLQIALRTGKDCVEVAEFFAVHGRQLLSQFFVLPEDSIHIPYADQKMRAPFNQFLRCPEFMVQRLTIDHQPENKRIKFIPA